MEGKYVAYYRVSTSRQGSSGLGLQAQREAVRGFLNGGHWTLEGEYTEVETAKGSNALARRPVLREAIAAAKKAKATLLIAKLDRLARNLHFISTLMETKVAFKCCDMPDANSLTIHIIGAMAQYERELISKRTKAALSAKKARGGKLGNAHLLKPGNDLKRKQANEFAKTVKGILGTLQAQGLTQRQTVIELNKLGIKAASGGLWSLVQLQRVLRRLG